MMQPRTLIAIAALWGMAAIVGLPLSASAGQQGTGGPGQMRMMSGEERIRHMSQMLRLSDAQRAKLRPIMKGHEDQISRTESDVALSQKDKQDKKKKIRESTDSKIMQILTPEQQRRFEQSRKIRGKMGLHE